MTKRIIYLLKIDWNTMGLQAYIPLFTIMFTNLYIRISKLDNSLFIPVFEITIPIFAAWWVIFVMKNYLEEPGGEIIFCLPTSKWITGILRALLFLIIYLIMLLISLLVMNNWNLILYLQLAFECFFYAGIGYLLIVLTKHSGWSLAGLSMIFLMQFMEIKIPLIPNIYLFNTTPLPFEKIKSQLEVLLFFGSCYFLIGQYYYATANE